MNWLISVHLDGHFLLDKTYFFSAADPLLFLLSIIRGWHVCIFKIVQIVITVVYQDVKMFIKMYLIAI